MNLEKITGLGRVDKKFFLGIKRGTEEKPILYAKLYKERHLGKKFTNC